MNADFLDAHHRHLRDADFLFGASRLANADHLYGMAAECGLKRLMIEFRMETNPISGSPKKHEDRLHADLVWMRYETYQSGHIQYGLPLDNPFSDWKAEQRYAAESHFTQTFVEPHKQAAHLINQLIEKAKKEKGWKI